jgi:RND family efflux transporter MFP subunit
MSNRKTGLIPSAIVLAIILVVAAIGLAFWGISTRARALTVVSEETKELAVPTVAVTKPTRGEAAQEIVLPGSIQAFADAPIYARTNGYLRKWYVDIGTRVKSGQLLADIDTPEVDSQLDQARADLTTAEANARLALTTAERYRELIKTDSVSKQDLDNANGGLEARQTAVVSARANVSRLDQLHAFGKIEAPFAGVITARHTDVGALIDSGSNARELFHIADVDRLRIFVNVPEVYSRAATPGLTADLTLTEFPGRRFAGSITRTSKSIDVASRTLLTEIDVENRSGELLPGSYVEVHLKLPAATTALRLPSSAVIFGTNGLRVATVVNGKASLVPVTLGRDYGDSIEVLSGLTGDEQVIVNPPDSIDQGETIQVVQVGPAK